MSGRDDQIAALTRIPIKLQALDRFQLFCQRPRLNGRRGKVPMVLHGKRLYPTSPMNSAAWLPFGIALEQLKEGLGDGLGLSLGPELGLVALDLDGVITAGQVDAAARTLAQRLDGYTETSVSGSGLHVLVGGVLPGPRRRGAGVELILGM